MKRSLTEIIDVLRSPHADKIFVAKEYTKAQLIEDLEWVRACAAVALAKIEKVDAVLERLKELEP